MLSIPLIAFTVLAFLGLLDALYILKHTKKNETLVCPIGFECNAVINSKYSTFLGMRNDILGVLFYLGMLSTGVVLVFYPIMLTKTVMLLKGATFGAAGFSLYLTYIQAFKLKNFCLYCLISAGFSISLFITSLYL